MRLWLVCMLAGCEAVFPLTPPDAATDAAGDSGQDDTLLIHVTFDSLDDFLGDAQGNPVTCVAGRCPTPGADRNGTPERAAVFDGSQCLQIVDRLTLRPAAFTFSVWARVPTPTGAFSLFNKSRTSMAQDANTFETFVTSTDQWLLVVNDILTSPPITANDWHHVVGTWDGSNQTEYIDGQLVGQLTKFEGAHYTTDPFGIGCDADNSGVVGLLLGQLDDVRFYNRPMTAEQVGELFAAGP